MSAPPERVLEKTIFWPSGDHAGVRSSPGCDVNWIRPVPSAFITHTSNCPERSEEKAIFVPSGDQAGDESTAECVVRRCTPEPSAFIE